ncbi:MAG: metal ABC transporter permease [Planctomycetota bacterium]|nr:metal ABC transporter permease [Planctomycetota bacterium]
MNEWTWAIDGWIIAVSALAAVACAIPGSFLVVRNTSMLADAISHAVLPGIAVGFLFSGTRDPLWMFIGAAAAGLLVALLSRALARVGRMDSGAALGIVFTTMFAIGLILIVQVADKVDLDPSCVLYGSVELSPLDSVSISGWLIPRAALVLGGVCLANIIAATLLWKSMLVTAFDPALALTLGQRPRLIETIVLGMAAATCVAAFESVGSILVVAMMIVPAATARLWSERLAGVMVGAAMTGVAASILGHWVAASGAPLVLAGGRDASTAGSVAATLGVLYAGSLLFAPGRGVLRRLEERWRLALRIAREDAIGLLWRLEEDGRAVGRGELHELLVSGAEVRPWISRVAINSLGRDRIVATETGSMRLTEDGRRAGAALVRSHRLWEIYLMRKMALAPDHVHPTAMKLEHITDAAMRDQLAKEGDGDAGAQGRLSDPHGRAVP